MACMNKLVSVIFTILVIAISPALAAAPAGFTGEWADKNYLKGKGVFQLSLEQKGSDVSVFLSAGRSDGSGAAPDADGKGKVTAKGTVEFTWEDSFKNSGTGTIKRAGNDVVVSLKPTHVIDSRCLEFYGDNIRLKPAGKK
jgi:FlaG/FlaF family flagellin (archaellin)